MKRLRESQPYLRLLYEKIWIKPPIKPLVFSICTLIVLFIGYQLIQVDYACDLTGFGKCVDTRVVKELRPEKTLWDWMELLLVPLVLAGGGLWFSQREKRYEQAIAAARAENDRTIAIDNQQEAALQTYFDRMADLLLDKDSGLRTSDEDSEVRAVARSRTLTALERLDGQRKASVVRFLYESGLIDKEKTIVSLRGANLERVNLPEANLPGANLEQTNLQEANLEGANLEGANMRGVDLREANLQRAELPETNLRKANLKGAFLQQAFLLRANLQLAYLQRADLPEAELEAANLQGAIYTKRTK